MNHTFIRWAAPLALALSLSLAACGGGGGGGGDGGNASANPPPPTNSITPMDAFLAYVQQLVGSKLDTAEPASVTAFDPAPTSETASPVATQ